ncbi:MAG: NACHT domain-containing protein [Streptomyces sp.]|nr:NACHT domain-containing protein [Streptomyces sp.]
MQLYGEPSGRRQALCIGFGRFGEHDGEPPVGTPTDLPFTDERIRALEKVLTSLGYDCTAADREAIPTSEALGEAVCAAIAGGVTGDVQVVHVLSHGHLASSGVYVVGADGTYAPGTKIEEWIARIEDFPTLQRPHVLFLVDTCHAGQSARLDWLPAAREGTRAWVIAATPPEGLAYNGWFTLALANVLTRLQAGEIDFYPGRYVPFGHVVEHVRREVALLGGNRQYVCGTPVDGNPQPPPFFPNPRSELTGSLAALRGDVDVAAEPFLDLDVALDAAHFLDRAAGRRELSVQRRIGCFTGREDELQALVGWLADTGGSSVQVVTGGAGSGKSALLGVLVCAVHPGLRESTRHLWEPAAVSFGRWEVGLATIHLRERTLADTLAALVRQLALPLPEAEANVASVITEMARLTHPPLLILDALDEAIAQDRIQQDLLLPLAHAIRLDGTPACRLVVGTRPWEQFHSLRSLAEARGGLLDLDAVPVERLRGELGRYVADLLSLAPGFEDAALLPARRILAHGVARTLTGQGRERGGEFLSAALFTNWVVREHPSGITTDEAAHLALRVPRTVPEILELDLETGSDKQWPRKVLASLAYAFGAGMPASVVRRVVAAFADTVKTAEIGAADPTAPEFDEVLRQVRFYLRSSPDTDGTTLYRLFHQSLVDHLRHDDVDLDELYNRLTAVAPPDRDGLRRWDAAEPYVVRHATQHAVEAGRLEELLQVSPEKLQTLFNIVSTRQGRLGAAIYRVSTARQSELSVPELRDLLAVNAARYGASAVLARLAGTSPAPTWFPRWATGGQLPSAQRAVLTGHRNVVSAVACMQLDGRPVAVTASDDGTLRVWDLANAVEARPPLIMPERITAMACAELEGRPIVVTGDDVGDVRVWDLATGDVEVGPFAVSLSEDHGSYQARVEALACSTVEGRPIVVTGCQNGQARVWDLLSGELMCDLAGRDVENAVRSMACTELEGRPVVVVCCNKGGRVWDLRTAEEIAVTQRGFPVATAVACLTLNGRTTAVTGANFSGQVQLWDVAGLRQIDDTITSHRDSVLGLDLATVGDRPIAVTASNDSSVRVCDLDSGTQIGEPLTGHSGAVNAVACALVEGRPVAVTAGRDGTVRIWDLTDDPRLGEPRPGHGGRVNGVACAVADGRQIAVTGSNDTTVAVWDLELGARIRELTGHAGWVSDVVCTELAGRPLAVTTSLDGTGRVWDLGSAQPIADPYTGVGYGAGAVDCSVVDGRAVAVTGYFDGTVHTWQIAGLRRRWENVCHGRHSAAVTAVACGKLDGSPIAVTGSHDRRVGVWDLRTGRQIGQYLSGHDGPVTAVACGELDGNPIVVSGSHDRSVRIWDLRTGQPLGEPLLGHTASVATVRCAALDGRPIVLTGSYDRTVRIWDPKTSAGTATYVMPDAVTAVSITSDGELLVGFGWEVACLSWTGRSGAMSERNDR